MEPKEREREKLHKVVCEPLTPHTMVFKHIHNTHGQAQAFNPSTQETEEARGCAGVGRNKKKKLGNIREAKVEASRHLQVQGQPGLHNEFKTARAL